MDSDARKELIAERILGFKGVVYNAQPDETPDSSEILGSCELLVEDQTSIAFTAALDWTLRVERGSWPHLPSWCRPSASWNFSDLSTPVGADGWDAIISSEDLIDEVGELYGVVLNFSKGDIVLKSGDSITWETRLKET